MNIRRRFVRAKFCRKGVSGRVFYADDRTLSRTVVVKKMKKRGQHHAIARETTILRQMNHAHVVELWDTVCDTTSAYLVMEPMDTDVRAWQQSLDRAIPPDLVRSLMWQLLSGLEYVHALGILHRDIKPENLLLKKEDHLQHPWHLKIGDWGLARSVRDEPPVHPLLLTDEVITRWYRPPELLLGATAYDGTIDVWSAGAILAELCNGKPLFPGRDDSDQLYQIYRICGVPTSLLWPTVSALPKYRLTYPRYTPQQWRHMVPSLDDVGRDLLSKMLVMDPSQRITAAQALQHPYFSNCHT